MNDTREVDKKTLFNNLEKLLLQECSVYEKYLKLLKGERTAVVKMKVDAITNSSWERSELNDQLEELTKRRKEILSAFPEGDKVKISEIIARHGGKAEAQRLSPIVIKLRKLVEETRGEGQELTQVLSFSQRLVGGMISIFSSASQSVTKLYTRKGNVSENYQPSPDRAQNPLKQA